MFGIGCKLRQVENSSFLRLNIGFGLNFNDTRMNAPLLIAIFTLSIAVHFLVVDYRMMEIYKGAYQQIGRWLLTLAPVPLSEFQ